MGKEYDFEIREQAEDLYIVEGNTFEQVSKETGVSVTQLKNWAAADGWKERKEEYRNSLKDIKSKMVRLRKALFEKALGSLEPQDIYAAVRLENVAIKETKKKDSPVQEADKPALFLKNLEFIAGILKDYDPEGLKTLARNFDYLIDRFKGNHEKEA